MKREKKSFWFLAGILLLLGFCFRQIREKRADISYISARNYLDTALKARYNAI